MRLRVNTHVSAAVIDRVPVPKPCAGDPRAKIVARLAAKLAASADPDAFTRLQATAASLYGIDRDQFAHVLETFPLVPRADRERAMAAFCDIFGRGEGEGTEKI